LWQAYRYSNKELAHFSKTDALPDFEALIDSSTLMHEAIMTLSTMHWTAKAQVQPNIEMANKAPEPTRGRVVLLFKAVGRVRLSCNVRHSNHDKILCSIVIAVSLVGCARQYPKDQNFKAYSAQKHAAFNKFVSMLDEDPQINRNSAFIRKYYNQNLN